LKENVRKETTSVGLGGEQTFPAPQVNTLCLLVIPLKIYLREGKVTGSEEGKAMGSELSHDYRGKRLSSALT
jgi:hypothetical protein